MNRKLVIIFLGLCLVVPCLRANAAWTTKRLTYNSGWSENPDIAVDSNDNLYIVWGDHSPGTPAIFFKKSTDGGASWTTQRLSYGIYAANPDMAIDSSDHIHVVYHDFPSSPAEIYYKKSTDGGTTWTTKRITYNSGNSTYSSIAIDSNDHLYIAWQDASPGNDEIYFKKSTNGGVTWTTKRLTYSSGISARPAIATDSNNYLHIVWHESISDDPEIYYKKSTDSGATWTTKRLTFNPKASYFPSIAISSGNHIHVVWMQSISGHEIFYKESTDSGATWKTKRLTYNSGSSNYPDVAVDSNGHPHVLWSDDSSGNYEIYYKRSTTGGVTWATERLTYNSGESSNPTIAMDSSDLPQVVWEDDSPGNFEIYLKQKEPIIVIKQE